MTRNILLFLLFVVLQAGEVALARWLPSPFVAPVLLPVLLTLALRVPSPRMARLGFLGGLAGEITSGIAGGSMLVALMGIPLLTKILVRRPDLPMVARGLVGIVAALVFSVLVQAMAAGPFLPPPRLVSQFIIAKFVVSSLFTGMVVILLSMLLDLWDRRRLAPLLHPEAAGSPTWQT